MSLPGYDAWKTIDPSEYRCEFCGVDMRYAKGWQPDECTGECAIKGWVSWRDPDYEHDRMMDEQDDA